MDKTSTSETLASFMQSIPIPLGEVDAWVQKQFQLGPKALKPLLDYAGRFRGKRMRAAQVLLVAKASGGLRPEHVQVAGILEMIHSATLVHDDLLDEAKQRRQLDCVHVEWGAHTAVLLGDWIYSQAFAASTQMEDQTCSRLLAQATGRVCAGEMHQNLTRGLFELNEESYFSQIDGKTAALFEAGGHLAAHYAGGSKKTCHAAARYGLLAGRAFQVVDDMLDLAGAEKEVGKSLGTDWQSGKMTLPIMRLRDSLPPAERLQLEQLFHANSSCAVLQQKIFAPALSHALESCSELVEKLLQEASHLLESLPCSEDAADLARLTAFLGARRF